MIEAIDEATDELYEAMQRLMPQLTTETPPPTRAQLARIVESTATTILVARGEAGSIVGTLVLSLMFLPTGLRARIDDVIVDEQARGQGIGRQLTESALEFARAAGARSVDLTSQPSREAANALYRHVGFHQRETNVYRYAL